jgi:hypothetical protein
LSECGMSFMGYLSQTVVYWHNLVFEAIQY